jgi:hypothetical protein
VVVRSVVWSHICGGYCHEMFVVSSGGQHFYAPGWGMHTVRSCLVGIRSVVASSAVRGIQLVT